jgi:hypothetical protein
MANTKDLNYYKNNCEEDYIKTPISVLRYITELEQALQLLQPDVMCSLCNDKGFTIEVEAECCRNFDGTVCCNMPDPLQVQKQCYCSGGELPI